MNRDQQSALVTVLVCAVSDFEYLLRKWVGTEVTSDRLRQVSFYKDNDLPRHLFDTLTELDEQVTIVDEMEVDDE